MSDLSKKLFDSLKNSLKDIVQETTTEFARLGTQGQMELAAALFNGHAFVPYGPGQYTPSRDSPHQEQQHQKEAEVGIER